MLQPLQQRAFQVKIRPRTKREKGYTWRHSNIAQFNNFGN